MVGSEAGGSWESPSEVGRSWGAPAALPAPGPAPWFWLGPDKCQVLTKTALSLPLRSWTGEREYGERVKGRDKDRERSLTNYCHGQTRLNLRRKGCLIHHQSNQRRLMRNKTRS